MTTAGGPIAHATMTAVAALVAAAAFAGSASADHNLLERVSTGPTGGNDKLRGGAGKDTLNGGKAKDRFDGGPANDTINARDKRRETVRCGKGRRDRVTADRNDRLIGCEKVG